MEKKAVSIVLFFLLIFSVAFVVFYTRKKERYFGEPNAACRWDSARRCTMSDGTEGNCAMSARCYPSFSKNRCLF